jgi:hypothetical protein
MSERIRPNNKAEDMFPDRFKSLAPLFNFPPELRSKVLHLLMVATNGNIPNRRERTMYILESEDFDVVFTNGGEKYDELYKKVAGLLVKSHFDPEYNVTNPQFCTIAAQYHEWVYNMIRPYCVEELTEGIHQIWEIDHWWDLEIIK